MVPALSAIDPPFCAPGTAILEPGSQQYADLIMAIFRRGVVQVEAPEATAQSWKITVDTGMPPRRESMWTVGFEYSRTAYRLLAEPEGHTGWEDPELRLLAFWLVTDHGFPMGGKIVGMAWEHAGHTLDLGILSPTRVVPGTLRRFFLALHGQLHDTLWEYFLTLE